MRRLRSVFIGCNTLEPYSEIGEFTVLIRTERLVVSRSTKFCDISPRNGSSILRGDDADYGKS